jgi:hypothetical protein
VFLFNPDGSAVVQSGRQPAHRIDTSAGTIFILQVNRELAKMRLETVSCEPRAVLDSFPETIVYFYAVRRNGDKHFVPRPISNTRSAFEKNRKFDRYPSGLPMNVAGGNIMLQRGCSGLSR